MRICHALLMIAGFSMLFATLLQAQDRPPRRIYLNGIDISSANHQLLERVNVRIDGQGNVFIEAPHYNVIEESSYVPLSSLATEQSSRPRHKEAGKFPDGANPETPIQPLRELRKQANPLPELKRAEDGDR